jgi:hypothetical protein
MIQQSFLPFSWCRDIYQKLCLPMHYFFARTISTMLALGLNVPEPNESDFLLRRK